MNEIDILENDILHSDAKLLSMLLIDKSSKRNIIWATDTIRRFENGYTEKDEITVDAITGDNGQILRPRVNKSRKEQVYRSKEKAEVFTPSYICNQQNNLLDAQWFSCKNLFNTEIENSWITNQNKIPFPTVDGKTWEDYVKDIRLEVTCGEAPYLVSRYDTISGRIIPINERIGLLDRKIRVVNENTNSQEEWLEWVLKAYQSIYGYEWQGDNLLLARENLLFTFIDYYKDRFKTLPNKTVTRKIANVVVWNIWQMDGLKGVIPYSCRDVEVEDVDLWGDVTRTTKPCDGCKRGDIRSHNGVYCKIKNWETGGVIPFISLIKQ